MWSSRPYDEAPPFIWWPTPVRSVEESVTQPTLDGPTPKSMGNDPVFAQSGERSALHPRLHPLHGGADPVGELGVVADRSRPSVSQPRIAA